MKSQVPVFTNHELPVPKNPKYHQPRIRAPQQCDKELLRLPCQEHKADALILLFTKGNNQQLYLTYQNGLIQRLLWGEIAHKAYDTKQFKSNEETMNLLYSL